MRNHTFIAEVQTILHVEIHHRCHVLNKILRKEQGGAHREVLELVEQRSFAAGHNRSLILCSKLPRRNLKRTSRDPTTNFLTVLLCGLTGTGKGKDIGQSKESQSKFTAASTRCGTLQLVDGDNHVLHLNVLVQAVLAELAANAALLEAAKGARNIKDVWQSVSRDELRRTVAVDVDGAGLQHVGQADGLAR